MPIRLNLLAEAQAQEDLRRRDPAKRAIWLGVAAVGAVLAWCASVQMHMFVARAEVSRLDSLLNARTNEYSVVMNNQKQLTDIKQKAAALHQLATNRFLQGSMLNALQQTVLDEVQLRRLRSEQAYVFTPGSKASTNSSQKVVPGKPATAKERVVVTLEALDSGHNAGDQVSKFKQLVADSPYLKTLLGQTNEVRLVSLSPPAAVPGGKPAVAFTLECRLPEKTRL